MIKHKKKQTPELGFCERNRRSGGYLLKKRAMDISVRIIRAVLLFGMCFLILQPILMKISVSFMEEQDLYNAMVINIPEHFTTSNYRLCKIPDAYFHRIFVYCCVTDYSVYTGGLRICQV